MELGASLVGEAVLCGIPERNPAPQAIVIAATDRSIP
jgi:predicted aconitase with swiveling domain